MKPTPRDAVLGAAAIGGALLAIRLVRVALLRLTSTVVRQETHDR
ncbi:MULTISPECIES: hypothetical protein [Aeromicrobium]|nr:MULTISPECIES: hypothetical protein [Aeromicrobium]